MRSLTLTVIAIAVVAPLPLSSTACKPASHERLRVVASVFPVFDLTRRIAGEDADVVLALPPGQSPHGFAPPGDPSLQNAHVYVLVGLGLDSWMDGIAGASPRAHVLRVGDRVPTRTIGDAIDPHVWLDPQRARLIVTAIGEELARADSSHASAFRRRASSVDASIAALDRELEASTAAWSQRGFVSFHASMGYYAERYRLDVLGAIESTPGVAPSAAEQSALAGIVAAHHVRAVFREPQLDGAPATALGEIAHVPVATLDPLGGSPTTGTYEELLRVDTEALAGANR